MMSEAQPSALKVEVREAATTDASVCGEIFAYYVKNTLANLQEAPPSAEYFVDLITKPGAPFYVAEKNGEVCGYAYADIMKTRCGYRRTMETSVYIRQTEIGGGLGGLLMKTLLESLRKADMLAAVAFITLPNPSSIRLHENLGFIRAGVMPGVGWKFNRAHDVGIWVKNPV